MPMTCDDMPDRIDHLNKIMGDCTLCPRNCHAKRNRGETGFCGLGTDIILTRALPHFGEEPPISGTKGAGTVFFSSCNLKCLYCQNWQISRNTRGLKTTARELANIFFELRDKGCHNIEAVTPTPQVPGLLEALDVARLEGLDLPVIFNCGGYENPKTIKLLDGIVDIWLPDFKYGSGHTARELSGAADYPERAIAAIKEMASQVGPELIVSDGVAERGIIIRHLVLPGMVENSIAALEIVAKEIPPEVPISIMSQYTPIPAMESHPALGSRLSVREYEIVLDAALELGFETIFTQDIDERNLAPDFDRKAPFQWL
jgi:putative pyruvate formate lyase activating enzyme